MSVLELTNAGKAYRLAGMMPPIDDAANARFAAGLRAQRAKLDLTQAEVSRRAGIHRSYLSDLERGRATATIPTACKLAEALETTVGELLGEPPRSVEGTF